MRSLLTTLDRSLTAFTHWRPGRALLAGRVLALAAAPALAQESVLVLSSGDRATDDAALRAFTDAGHHAVLGPEYFLFDGSGLSAHTVVYLQPNVNWSAGDMSDPGQASLIDFVCRGGGLITSEWTVYNVGQRGTFQALGLILPATFGDFTTDQEVTFSIDQFHPEVHAGVPASFDVVVPRLAGTESRLDPRPGATSFMTTDTFPAWREGSALAAWDWGQGRVACFSTVNGDTQLASDDFRRLLGNLARYVGDASTGGGLPCTADCDGDGALTIFDFLCFQNRFTAGDPAADCDCNGRADLFDFLCFQNLFDAGC